MSLVRVAQELDSGIDQVIKFKRARSQVFKNSLREIFKSERKLLTKSWTNAAFSLPNNHGCRIIERSTVQPEVPEESESQS